MMPVPTRRPGDKQNGTIVVVNSVSIFDNFDGMVIPNSGLINSNLALP